MLRRVGAYSLCSAGVASAGWMATGFAGGGASALALTPLALAVALSAWYGGVGPGLWAALSSAFLLDYFIVEPGSLLRFASALQAAAFAMYVLGWTVFSVLAERVLKRMRRERLTSLA